MTFTDAYPRVRMKIVKADGVYRVHSCLVWPDSNRPQFIASEDHYQSTAAAYAEMKRRVMNLFWERGRVETEREVNWVMESEEG